MHIADFVLYMFVCPIGIQIPGTSLFNGSGTSIILWCVLFSLFSNVEAVCPMCYGNAIGCSASSADACPWSTGVASNVAAVAAAVGAVITLDALLPARYLRLFTRPVLQTLAIIAAKPKGGTAFPFSGKSYREIYHAVVGGHVTKDEAIAELSERLDAAESSSEIDATLIKQLERGIGMVQKATTKVVAADVTDGTFLYVLAKLSSVYSSTGTFDLCVTCDDEDEPKKGTQRFAASLKRPTSPEQMFALLHQFQMVCVTAGLTPVMAMGPFLDEVVYEPLRVGVLEWPVAFELMIVYLRMVENEPARYSIGTVVGAAGGMDAKRAEATSVAKGMYASTCFRRTRVEPRDVDDDKDKKTKGVFKGDVKGHNETGERGCAAWNNGNAHLSKHIDPATNKCKFRHACNQYVTDKGPGGQCLRNHRRKDGCDYDVSKKCSQPLP